MKFDDAVLGLTIAVFGAVIVYFGSEFRVLRHISYGPGFFPTIIGAGLVLCGVLLLGRRVLAGGLRGPWMMLGDWSRSPRHIVNMVLIPVSVIFYILASDTLGFFISMVVLLVVQIGWFTRKPLRSVIVAVAVTVLLQEFFQGFMSVPLPWGVLEPFAGALTWM